MPEGRPRGFWVISTLSVLLLIILFVGQTMSFIDYDFTVSLGLQESYEMVGALGIAINKGFGVGDTIIYIPLALIGLAGLCLKRMWGVFAMTGAMGITAYWPMVSLFFLRFAKGSPGFNFTSFTNYTIMLVLISAYGVWGLWYLYTRRKVLAN